jgi:hypothetical protein
LQFNPWPALLRIEARHSVALDGDTIAVTCSAPRRAQPGFGCGHCGAPLDLAAWPAGTGIVRGLPCCGFMPAGAAAARLLTASRLVVA